MSETKKILSKGANIICTSCGAQFDEMLPKCPYCESMSVRGAEAEYMDKLEAVRTNLEDLSDVPFEETKKEFKKQTKLIFTVVGVVIGLLLLLFGVEYIMDFGTNNRDRQADYIWQQENYPILNELYEQEKYAELVELFSIAIEEDKPVYSWEHYAFCSAMELYLHVEKIWAKEQAGEDLSHWDYEDLLYIGFRVDNYEESTAYSTEEKARLAPYIAKVRADFETRWEFTEEERKAFQKEAEENAGYISYDVIKEYIEKWMDRRDNS